VKKGGSPPRQRPNWLVRHLITIFGAILDSASPAPSPVKMRHYAVRLILPRGLCRAQQSPGWTGAAAL
jgi:hypothetical protein